MRFKKEITMNGIRENIINLKQRKKTYDSLRFFIISHRVLLLKNLKPSSGETVGDIVVLSRSCTGTSNKRRCDNVYFKNANNHLIDNENYWRNRIAKLDDVTII